MKSALISAALLAAVLVAVAVNGTVTRGFADRLEDELSALSDCKDDPEKAAETAERLHSMWIKELPRLLVTTNKAGLLSTGEAFDRLLAHADDPSDPEFEVCLRQLELAFRYIRSLEMVTRSFG